MVERAQRVRNNPPAASRPPRWQAARPVLGVLWVALVGLGFWWLVRYEIEPGAGSSLARWPAGTELALDGARPTLLVFVHPRCPCSRATIAELDRLVTGVRERARVEVLVYDDPALGPDWAESDLTRSARHIVGASVARDPHGALARRFDALTSGQALLFAPDGRLLFRGGITDARGHEGDNPGSQAVLALLDDPSRAPLETPVFGCSLVDPTPPVARAESLP